MFTRVAYADLNSRQKENYNFQKVAARLAEYGYNCLRLTDDWQGADFIACHIDGETLLRVQLKGRMCFDAKYYGKGLHIAFLRRDEIYVYPHDELRQQIVDAGFIEGSNSEVWVKHGSRSWPTPPAWAFKFLQNYRV